VLEGLKDNNGQMTTGWKALDDKLYGQKTNPIGNRLGIIRGWESNWYGGNDYGDKLAEDQKLRNYVFARLSKASVSRVIIERTLKLVTLTITTARLEL